MIVMKLLPAILEARASHGGNGNMDNTEVSYESNPDYRERNMCSRDPSRLHIDGGVGKRSLSPCTIADNRCSAPGKSNSPSSPARSKTRPAEIAKRKRARAIGIMMSLSEVPCVRNSQTAAVARLMREADRLEGKRRKKCRRR